MKTINLNQQISILRKEKGLTQEELAVALGVTNQAVSKWESAQCCPDIQLLPQIAELFQVSVDRLLGCSPVSPAEIRLPSLCEKIDSLSQEEALAFAYRTAAALHALTWHKYMTKLPNQNPGLVVEELAAHAADGEWGYSCLNTPEFTTVMHQGAVFFSDNGNCALENSKMHRLISLLKPFTQINTLKTASALYQLTCRCENAFATAAKISEKGGLSKDKTEECLQENLSPFLLENAAADKGYRFHGRYENIIPVLSLFAFAE